MGHDEQLELLRSAVSLRVQSRDVSERVRRELALVEAALLRVVGPLVRKRVAAALLAVSVQALDKRIAANDIPTAAISDTSQRQAIPTEHLVGLAAETELVRRAGGSARPLSQAIDALRERTWRQVELVSAINLTEFSHQIAAQARERRRNT